MRAFASMFRISLRQVIGGKRWLGLGLLALLPGIVMWLSSANLNDEGVFWRFHDAPLPTLLLLVLPVVSVVIASGALGDERRDATLSFLLVRPVARRTIVLAKWAAAWVAAAGLVGVAGVLASGVFALRTGSWQTLAPTLIAVVVGTACYVSMFLVVGYLTSRAVLIGLVYVFVWESGISFAAPALASVSLSRIALTAYVGMLPESASLLRDPMALLAPGAGGALGKALVIGALAVAAGAWILRRTDSTTE